MLLQSVMISEHAANSSITWVDNSFNFMLRMFTWKYHKRIQNNREQFQHLVWPTLVPSVIYWPTGSQLCRHSARQQKHSALLPGQHWDDHTVESQVGTFFQAVESIAIVATQTDAAKPPSLVVNTAGFTVTGCSPSRTCICYGGLTCKMAETFVHLSFSLIVKQCSATCAIIRGMLK